MSDYKPRQAFLPFHNRDKRWSCLVAHRRAGKTVACINELLTRALATKKPNARYGYIAPFYSQAKQIAWDYLKQYGQSIIIKVNESELSVELFSGAKIRLFGADNHNALRGMFFDGVILDEYADMRPSVWGEVIRPALADRRGWAVFIGTPKGNNEFYNVYQRSKDDNDWFSLILRASESGLIAQSELNDARKVMSEDQYEQEFECSFSASLVGSYYGKLINEMEKDGRITSVPYNPAFEVNTIWDIGGDGTSIWFFQQVGREPRLIDIYEATGSQLSDEVKMLKDKPYNYGTHILPHDAGHDSVRTGMTMEQQLKDLGLKNTEVLPRDDIDPGIQLVKQLLPQLWIDAAKCKLGIEALKNYQRKWNDERKVFSETPLHNWASHTSDALRYLAIWLATKKAPIVKKPEPQYYGGGSEQGWMV